MSKELTCRFGHNCTSSCGNDYDCPCQVDHCCALTQDCDETCDDCFNREVPDIPGFEGTMEALDKLTIIKK